MTGDRTGAAGDFVQVVQKSARILDCFSPVTPGSDADPVALTMPRTGRTVDTALRQWLPRCGT
jgi:hypothetical protein